MREMVRSYFAASRLRGFAASLERLNDTGLPIGPLTCCAKNSLPVRMPKRAMTTCRTVPAPDAFRASAGLTDAQWAENAPSLRREMREARWDQIR